ncbi:MAG: zinc metalloprotease HtpX [Firmicutes bacterium]|nr:zinc metalloprotease HtpX [Bacillota bacterium]
MNTMKVWLLMGGLTVLLVALGGALFGRSGATMFLVIALALNFFSYFYSDKIAIKMTGSYPVTQSEAPELYEIVGRLTQRAGIPMPKLYMTPSPQPNAFATGRDPSHAAVAVTEGIMRLLNRTEVEGVLAHELSHVKNRDVLVGSLAATLAGAITMMANAFRWAAIFGMGRDDNEGGGGLIGGLAMAILAPLAALLIQMAISRSREYKADADGARLIGSGEGLAGALLKLESAAQRIPMQTNPAASHLFIVNPLSGQSFARLFSTHPSTEERVARLRAMRV